MLGFLPYLLFGLDLNGGRFCDPSGDHNKSRMRDHTVFRAYGAVFDVPKSEHVFHDLYTSKPGVRVERIYQRFDLQHRGKIAHENPTRPEDFSCVRYDLPRLGEIDQDAINLPDR